MHSNGPRALPPGAPAKQDSSRCKLQRGVCRDAGDVAGPDPPRGPTEATLGKSWGVGAWAGRRHERPRGGIGGEQPGHLGLGYAGGPPCRRLQGREGPLGLRRERGGWSGEARAPDSSEGHTALNPPPWFCFLHSPQVAWSPNSPTFKIPPGWRGGRMRGRGTPPWKRREGLLIRCEKSITPAPKSSRPPGTRPKLKRMIL